MLTFEQFLSETTVYHGSRSPIDQWDSSKHFSGYYPGFYTFSDRDQATKFGNHVYAIDIDPSKFYSVTHLNADTIKKDARKAGFRVSGGSGAGEAEYLKSRGFEGIKRGMEYIIFHPEKYSLQEG